MACVARNILAASRAGKLEFAHGVPFVEGRIYPVATLIQAFAAHPPSARGSSGRFSVRTGTVQRLGRGFPNGEAALMPRAGPRRHVQQKKRFSTGQIGLSSAHRWY
jgi:hypothetical protein